MSELEEKERLNPSQQHYEDEFNKLTGTPDMQALNDQADAGARDGFSYNPSSGGDKTKNQNSLGKSKEGSTGGKYGSAADKAINIGRKVGGKAGQAAGDAVDSAKLAANYASIAAGNAKAVADIAKDIIRNPRAFLQKNKNLLKYAAIFGAFQFAILGLFLILALLPIFKLVWIANETAKGNYKAPLEALNMITDKASREYIIDAASKFTTNKIIAEGSTEKGVVNAQGTGQKPENLNTNVTDGQKKMYEGFERGKLYEKLQSRGVEITHNGGQKSKDGVANPEAFDLIVGGQNWGNLASEKAEAYIFNFNRDVLKDNELFMRGSVKSVALKNGRSTLKNEHPDPGLDFQKARDTVYGTYFKNTTAPVTKNAAAYDKCRLVNGGSDCDSLGALGNVKSPENRKKNKDLDIPAGSVSQSVQSTQVKDLPNPNDPLLINVLAKIRTGASNGIQDAFFPNNKNGSADDEAQKKDTERLTESGRRLQDAAQNGNVVKTDYVMKGEQSTQFFIDTAADGGCLLNFECGLVNSAIATDRMNIAEQSFNFQRAYLGGMGGIFADGDANAGKECETIFNDDKPIDADPKTRKTTQVDCVNTQLIPDKAQQAGKWGTNPFLKKLSEQVKADDNKSWWESFKDAVKAILGRLLGIGTDKIRNAPYTGARVNMQAPEAQKNAPNTDGAINGEIGIAQTGLEVSGSAYDQADQGVNYIASVSNFTDNPFNIGAADLNTQQVASLSQYLNRKEQTRFAIKSLSTRLFSLKESGSLATKMAMLSPSNLGALTYKSYALLKPQSLSSFASVQLAPRAFAAGPNLNLAGGKVAGYTVENLQCLNKHTDKQIMVDKVCGNIGEQKRNTDPNRPGNTPITVDYTKLHKVAANTATCYIDPQSGDCNMPGSGAISGVSGIPASTGGTPSGDAFADDSSATPCDPQKVAPEGQIKDLGTEAEAYTKMKRIKVRLCALKNIPCTNEECNAKGPGAYWVGNSAEGFAIVNSVVSSSFYKMADEAKKAGLSVLANSTFRTMAHQQALFARNPNPALVARPGGSNHQSGTAIDFAGTGGATGGTCGSPANGGTPFYKWLTSNAKGFGIYQYPNESWHWEGGNNRCGE